MNPNQEPSGKQKRGLDEPLEITGRDLIDMLVRMAVPVQKHASPAIANRIWRDWMTAYDVDAPMPVAPHTDRDDGPSHR